MRWGTRRAELLEHLSVFDDALLEEIVEDRAPAVGALYTLCARVLGENRVSPAFTGSALKSAGLVRLTKALRQEAVPPGVLRAQLPAGTVEEQALRDARGGMVRERVRSLRGGLRPRGRPRIKTNTRNP